MAKKTFNDLSVDLKTLVIDQINRPSDIKNICLASKQCHEIAVRSLYHTVGLDLGGPFDTRLSAFLNPQNKGLKYIRKIRLYLANVQDTCNQLQQAHLVTKMILEFLPEDVLEEFRWDQDSFNWCPWSPFSAENLLLLYKKQKRMKWLEAMTLDRPNILQELQAKPAEYDALFTNCRRLAFYPETRDTLDLCNSFLVKTKNIEEIIVHTNFDYRSPTIPARELNDSATGPGLITRSIFKHMLPFDKCTPMAGLKALRLHKVNLRHCADTYCRIVDFANLSVLRIFQCPGADALLSQLCKSSLLPKKLEVLELQHKDNEENDALIALDGLLCLVSGLRDLVIELENVKTVPAAAGICRHGKTLEMLNIHAFPKDDPTSHHEADELVWPADEFKKICKSAPELEQLCCAFPPTDILSSPSEDWMEFSRSVTSIQGLVTLSITTWPASKATNSALPRSIYEHLLQGLSQKLFELATGSTATRASHSQPSNSSTIDLSLLPPSAVSLGTLSTSPFASQTVPTARTKSSKLRIVAFGASDKIFERQDSNTQSIFHRSTQTTAESKEAVHAVPIGWCLRQYVEPRSDVLDFALSPRVPAMPVREWEQGEDSD